MQIIQLAVSFMRTFLFLQISKHLISEKNCEILCSRFIKVLAYFLVVESFEKILIFLRFKMICCKDSKYYYFQNLGKKVTI
jgi:hypothetical protein